MPLGHAKFHVNWCNESSLHGKNADFQPLSKNIYWQVAAVNETRFGIQYVF